MNAKVVEVPQWWFVPQAIVWIVTCNEDEAAGTPDLASLDQLPPLAPNQFVERPPISKVDAPRELLRAWHEGAVIIFGAKNGQGEPVAVPKPKYPFEAGFVTHHARLWLEVRIEVGAGPVEFWTSLSVRPAHCKARWPAPSGKSAETDSEQATRIKDNDPASPKETENGTRPDNAAVNAYLIVEQARRIEAEEKYGMNEVRIYLRGEFPHLSTEDADRFYNDLDDNLKPKSGPKGPWKNKLRST